MTTPLKFHWFLPTNGGDGRHVVSGGHGVDAGSSGRPASVGYLGQVTRSAEQLGFEAALTPTGAWCEDAWLSTAMLSSVSERLKFLVAFRPGLTSPTLSAQMAGDLPEHVRRPAAAQRRHRRREPRAARVRRLPRQGRPLRPVRRVPHRRPPPVDRRDRRLRGRAPPRRGRRAAADPRPGPRDLLRRLVAGRRARWPPSTSTSTSPGASRPAAVAEKVEWIRKLAADEGREIRFGIRMHTITRDTSEEAWAEADRLLAGIDDETIAQGPGRPAARASPRASAGCSSSTRAAGTTSRSTPTCGPASAWSAAAPAPRWSAATRRSPTGSRSTPRSASTSSCSRRTRTSRAPTGSARACCRSSSKRGRWTHPAPATQATSSVPFGAGGTRRVVTRPRRRRGRQPQAGVAHPRRPRRTSPASWPASPTSSSTSPTLGAGGARLGGPARHRAGRAGRCGRPGRRRLPDLQGHLHRTAQGVPRPVRGRHRPARRRRAR